MFEKLLIAVDGSELSKKALDAGLELARAHGSRIMLLTATDPVTSQLGEGGFGGFAAGSLIESVEAAYSTTATKILEAAKERASKDDVAVETAYVPRQRAADAILQQAEELGCDLIVMGSHGRRGLQKIMLGSQASEVLTRSSIPVLIVK